MGILGYWPWLFRGRGFLNFKISTMEKSYRIPIKREMFGDMARLSAYVSNRACRAMAKAMKKSTPVEPAPAMTFEESDRKVFAIWKVNFA